MVTKALCSGQKPCKITLTGTSNWFYYFINVTPFFLCTLTNVHPVRGSLLAAKGPFTVDEDFLRFFPGLVIGFVL